MAECALGCHCNEPLEPSHLAVLGRVHEAEQTQPGEILKLWVPLNESARRSIERALTVTVDRSVLGLPFCALSHLAPVLRKYSQEHSFCTWELG